MCERSHSLSTAPPVRNLDFVFHQMHPYARVMLAQRQRGWNDAWMALPETDNKKRGPKGKVFYVKSTCKSKQVAAPAPFQHMGKFVRLFWVAVSDRSDPSFGAGGLSTFVLGGGRSDPSFGAGGLCTFVLVGGLGSLGSLTRYGDTLSVCFGWRFRIVRIPHSVRVTGS